MSDFYGASSDRVTVDSDRGFCRSMKTRRPLLLLLLILLFLKENGSNSDLWRRFFFPNFPLFKLLPFRVVRHTKEDNVAGCSFLFSFCFHSVSILLPFCFPQGAYALLEIPRHRQLIQFHITEFQFRAFNMEMESNSARNRSHSHQIQLELNSISRRSNRINRQPSIETDPHRQ